MPEEKQYSAEEIEILYNIPGNFIYFIRSERHVDGNVVFYDLETNEEIDLESYAIHGYKMVKDKSLYLNMLKKGYTLEELISIAKENDGLLTRLSKDKLDSSSLTDLNWLRDYIDQQKYNLDMLYPVEQIEVRYSEVFDDYLFLYVTFDLVTKRLAYMDIITGKLVPKEILDLYTYFPRDDLFHKDSFSPNDIIRMKKELQHDRALGKRRNV